MDMLPRHVGGRYPTPGRWWLVTEFTGAQNARCWRSGVAAPCPLALQTSTLPSSSRAKNLVDGARVELAFHGCRPWVIPLYEPPNWGEMRESNSRDWSHNPVPKPFGQSRHKTSGAGRVNRTLVGEVQALCTATVLDQQTLGAGTQPRTAVGRLPCACSSR